MDLGREQQADQGLRLWPVTIECVNWVCGCWLWKGWRERGGRKRIIGCMGQRASCYLPRDTSMPILTQKAPKGVRLLAAELVETLRRSSGLSIVTGSRGGWWMGICNSKALGREKENYGQLRSVLHSIIEVPRRIEIVVAQGTWSVSDSANHDCWSRCGGRLVGWNHPASCESSGLLAALGMHHRD